MPFFFPLSLSLSSFGHSLSGTVSTDLSAPFQKNVKPEKLFSRAYAVSCLMQVVDSLERSHTGKFFAYDGSEIPW